MASGGPADATPVDTGKNQLWLAAPVTVVKDVVRDQLSNSHAISTKAEHPGSVEITTGGGAFQALSFGQGSDASNWAQITASYNGNLRNGVRPLPIGIVLAGNGTSQPVDIIRRPVQGENATNPAVLAERYFAQASLKIIISDSKSDITSLPCVSAGNPVNLADLTLPVAAWTSPNAIALRNAMIANGTLPLPLAASGATGATYDAGNGYRGPNGTPIVTGFIKIDAQTAYGNPCGSWKDVTLEVLGLGYAGRNLNPVSVAPRRCRLCPVLRSRLPLALIRTPMQSCASNAFATTHPISPIPKVHAESLPGFRRRCQRTTGRTLSSTPARAAAVSPLQSLHLTIASPSAA